MSRLFNPFKSVTQFFSKTSEKFQALFSGKKTLTADDEKSLETLLLSADVGVSTTRDIINTLRGALNEETDPKTVLSHLLYEKLRALEKPLQLSAHPFVILMVGVNGAGKTTTIGKLTHYFKSQGKSVMLEAGDTFRAAATEQLQKIAEKNGFTAVIAQESGADSAALIFDAYQSAKAKKVDVLIADTAGRLHTQDHLMKELQKILRVLKKIDEIEYNIDENMKKKYLELNETINNLHFYKDELKKNIKKEHEIKDQEVKAIESSSEYSDEEKQFFLKIEQTNYIKLKKQNKLLTKRISELEENIASIKLIIKLYEENLI